jgi:two-component system chemotaxis response regulator CheB
VAKVKTIAGVDMGTVSNFTSVIPQPVSQAKPLKRLAAANPSHVVAIGTSTGGPVSLEAVLTELPADYDGAILVVQHMPVGFTHSLSERLNRICRLDVREAAEGDRLSPGTVLIAKSGFQLRFRRRKEGVIASLTACDQETLHCPSADVMMTSIADVWRGPLLGIVMTGMGDDGTEGIGRIKDRGGTTLAQDEASCIVFGMPKAAFESGRVDQLVPLSQLARKIKNFYAGLVLKRSSIKPIR